MTIEEKIQDREEIIFLITDVRLDPSKENKEKLFEAIKEYNIKYGEKFEYIKGQENE